MSVLGNSVSRSARPSGDFSVAAVNCVQAVELLYFMMSIPVISVILLSPSFGRITFKRKAYIEIVEGRKPPPITLRGI